MHPKFLEKYFSLQTKASKKLEEEVEEELKKEDPSEEEAQAVLEQ